MKFSVRILCRRSASLTSRTRTSSAMASRSLRKFSACWARLGDEIELLELGQAIDERADLLAEYAVDLLARRRGVLDRVMQHGGDDGRVVELEIGQDRGDFERMREKRIAGGAFLRAVRLHGVDIGAIQQILVGVRIVATHAIDKFILPHHCYGRPHWRSGHAATSLNIGPASGPCKARRSFRGAATRRPRARRRGASGGATKNPGALAPGFPTFVRIRRDQKSRVI